MLNVKYGSALCKFENGVYCLIFYNDLIQSDSRIPEEAGFVMQGLLSVLRLRIPSPSERSHWASLSLWLRWTTANRGTIQGCFSSSYQTTNRVYLSLLHSLCIQRQLSSFLPVPTHSLFSWRAMSLEGHLWAHSTTHTLTVCLRQQQRPMSQDSDSSFKIAHSLWAHPSLSSLILCPSPIFSF